MSPKKKFAGIEHEVPQNTKSTVVRLCGHLHGQRVRLTVVALSIVIYVALSIWNPMYSAIVIDHLWQSVQAAWHAGIPFSVTGTMGRELIQLTVQYLFTWLFYYLQSYLMANVAESLVLEQRSQISRKLNRLPLRFFDQNKAGEILSRVTNDLDKIAEVLQTGLLKLIVAIGTIIGSLIVMFYYGGRLPVHVRCLLDEFANIGQIPNFDKLIATIRSREISASIILQSQSQLKTIYKDAADTIVGNCDSTLFLGGKEKSTLKEISELLGKETIDSFNQSENRGSQVSHGLTYQKLGKELMTQDELAVMDGGKCIFMLRGVRPFLSDKYDLTKHPNYKYTADADKKYLFDMERYMKRKPAIVKPDEPFEMYELTATDLQ